MKKKTTPAPIASKATATPEAMNRERSYPQLEFHLRPQVTLEKGLELPLFALNHGRFQIDLHGLQQMLHTLNQELPEAELKASDMYGIGIISLLHHKMMRLYRNQVDATFLASLEGKLSETLGPEQFDTLLSDFLKSLPSESVIKSGSEISEFLDLSTGEISHRQVVLEELIVHLLSISNQAFQPYEVTFRENFNPLVDSPEELLQTIQTVSEEAPGFGPDNLDLINLLVAPMRSAPGSIQGQLEYILKNWGTFLGSHLSDLLRGIDLFEEEQRFRGAGPGEIRGPEYTGDLLDSENYSQDSDWMPRVVMIARNSLVWLDQLSKRYERSIQRLDQIPDEELDLLAQQGFTVLWLIGLWERSDISRRIKHWCGNPDAESSAYSLKGYMIDPMLGGEGALEDLRRRAWERGIRLASDMVPNHTGLDSDWLKHHPEWFISATEPPFPSYTFDGGDLSEDPELSIHLEDHYYERSDAAVVFKHVDHRNGMTRYVYHGNDGTSMPWNDTAQLNYLNPELREEVIQTILNVARQFKVIRFDAAMTLAKRHIQRLWFPEPGHGGDIPSRSFHSMSAEDFQAALPAEFWREVVDRVAREVPDTLLLAEAFWMMEGYFVRTLGMHRVYNSAFMNMLKMEDNAKFFGMIAETLEFDPRILQRFVNFLSNPDEDTAIAQFGKGDKYFGATMLMVTLPGLPMFAHAQIEGFEEKYGMEYRRAYWDEHPDKELIERHRQEIFPLMKKRYLFAGASDFRLFPFWSEHGGQVHSVFAYSNRSGTERSLVLVNNAYESHSGWITTAVPVNTDASADQPALITDDLIMALSFDVDDTYFVIFQEQISGLWYIRSIREMRESGLRFTLNGYESQVYLNWQLVSDTQSTPWTDIYGGLGHAGVKDFAPLFRSMELEPVKQLFVRFFEERQLNNSQGKKGVLLQKFAPLFESMLEMDNIVLSIEQIEAFSQNYESSISAFSKVAQDDQTVKIMAMLVLARQLGIAHPDPEFSLVRTYELGPAINSILEAEDDQDAPGLIAVLEHADNALEMFERDTRVFFKTIFARESARRYFMIHDSEGVSWFNAERMGAFLKNFQDLFGDQFSDKTLKQINAQVLASKYKTEEFLNSL